MSINGIPNAYKDFFVEVQQGNVPGYSIVHKFGRNDSVLNGAWSLVSPSSPSGSFPASGSPVRIKAGGDGADTSSGAGAREITVIGINTNLQEAVETIVTSGANASSYTTNSFWRLYRAYVSSVGTYSSNNVDDIVMENSEDRMTILAGEGQTQHGAFSIPEGKTGYLLGMVFMADGTKAADFRVFTRENFNNTTAPMSSKRIRLYLDGILGQERLDPRSPILVLPALSDIWVEARGGGQGTEVSVDFEILLIDNPIGHIKQV